MSSTANLLSALQQKLRAASEIREESVVASATQAFLESAGGVAKVAELIKSLFDLAVDSDDLDEKRKALGLLRQFMEGYDTINAQSFDLSGVDEAELDTMMAAATIRYLAEEPALLLQTTIEAARSLPPAELDRYIEELTAHRAGNGATTS